MTGVLIETLWDTAKTVPFLFCIYLLLEFLQSKARHLSLSAKHIDRLGPLAGGTVGCIPQCGFSAVAATLYNEGVIRGGTAIAVFLATSDEAIPVLLSGSDSPADVGLLILVKLVVAIASGYLLNATLFRSEVLVADKPIDIEFQSCETCSHHIHKRKIMFNALFHTFKITAYILITMLLINIAVYFLGEERFSAMILSGSVFQPFVTALMGLIPGCSISVLMTQLYIGGQIPFGSAIAGLCTGAGFGYVILSQHSSVTKALKVIAITYAIGVTCGLIINSLAAGLM